MASVQAGAGAASAIGRIGNDDDQVATMTWMALKPDGGEQTSSFKVKVPHGCSDLDEFRHVIKAAKPKLEHVDDEEMTFTLLLRGGLGQAWTMDRAVESVEPVPIVDGIKTLLLVNYPSSSEPHTAATTGPAATVPSIARGLPPLAAMPIGSPSPASESAKKHAPATIIPKTFGSMESFSSSVPSSIWASLGLENELRWGSESDIQGLVNQVLKDVVQALGLQGKVDVLNELSVTSFRPDIWLVTRRGVPIGVVEVKKPAPGILDNPVVLGQLLDYMGILEVFHGVKGVFGIVATYQQWRVCWRNDQESNETAASLLVMDPYETATDSNLNDSAVGRAVRYQLDELRAVPTVETDIGVGVGVGESAASSLGTREICCSRIYDQSDGAVVSQVLASAIRKMQLVVGSGGLCGVVGEACIRLTPETWTWGTLPAELAWDKYPAANTKNFNLVYDFRSGPNGRAWLACSDTGAICVLKFVKRGKSESDTSMSERIRDEVDLWHTVYGTVGKCVRIVRLDGAPAIMMPFVPRLHKEKRNDEAVIQALRKTVRSLAAAGIQHTDVAWRHVGIYEHSDRPPVVILFDLSNFKPVNRGDTDDTDAAISQMLAKLGLTE